jgi:hypothetical protein
VVAERAAHFVLDGDLFENLVDRQSERCRHHRQDAGDERQIGQLP